MRVVFCTSRKRFETAKFAVWFPRAMKTVEDLIANFRVVLPALRAAHNRARS